MTSALKGLNMRPTKAEYIEWMTLNIQCPESPCNKQNGKRGDY